MQAAIFYFVRHGQTAYNAEKRIQSWLPIPLNETGIGQAKALAKKVENIPFSACYTSELRRAHQTAEIIANDRSTRIIQDARINERNRGSWAGKLESEFEQAPASEKQDQEDDSSMRKRIFEFLNETAPKHMGEKVLVVTHERVICNIAIELLGLACAANELSVANTGELECSFSDGKWSVVAFQEIRIPEIVK